MQKLLCILLFLLLAAQAVVAEEPHTLIWGVIPDYSPYSFIDEEGQLRGFVVELISQILQELEIPYIIHLDSWNQLYPKLIDGDVHVYGPFVRFLAREPLLHWPRHYLATSYTTLATLAPRESSAETLAGITAVVVEGDHLSQSGFEYFMSALALPYNLLMVSTTTEAVQLLERGTADGLVIDAIFARAHPELVANAFVFGLRQGYWTTAIDSPEWVRDVTNRVSDRVDELRQDPASIYYALYAQYFSNDTPALIEVFPVWLLFIVAVLFAVTIISLIIVHFLTIRIRQHALELSQAVEQKTRELTQVYARLIQSEKMVTLGEAVAGIAHEIATPIGVAYTAVTLLKTSVETGDTIETVSKDTLPVIIENLKQAGMLLQNFKRVTIDQTSGALQRVLLPDYMEHLWTGVSQKYTIGDRISFVTRFEDENANTIQAEIFTYPGALSRMLISLFENAIEHGIGNRDHGTVWCTCQRTVDINTEDVFLEFIIEDDGYGYEKEIESKLMEPFFTTCVSDSNHPGLGLPAAYRIAEKTWKLLTWNISIGESGGMRICIKLQVLSDKEKEIFTNIN